MSVSKLEKQMGIEVYATRSSGIGGAIRQSAEDFVVEEILVDGSKATVNDSDEIAQRRVLTSSDARNRYLLCVLEKRNWDTFLALKVIAGRLSINPGRIHIAGIKDAKAVTAQHVTIEDVSAENVLNIKTKGILIRPVGYLHHKISSYYLLGNSFHVTIKNVGKSETTINNRITHTTRELEAIGGIPNFYGHQRFGTTRSITHLVGKAIVEGDFRKASMLFLARASRYEHPESRAARRQLQDTQDFKKALKDFPKQLHFERMMLKHLAAKPEDYVGAFRRLPVKLRQLFVQAFQSYLFNKCLSRRLQNDVKLNIAETGDYVVNVERTGLPMLTMHRTAGTSALNDINQDIENGRMRVAIPLIGFKQQTSRGAQGEKEKQVLEEEGISAGDFRVEAMPEISARGELRTALTLLRNFHIDKISKDSAAPSKKEFTTDFMLHRGSYATILLRELMKPRSLVNSGF